MNKIRWQIGILALILGAFTALAQTTTAEVLFREALMKERAEGNLREAIFRYERIIADFSGDRQFAAQAMYQLSQIYGKQRNPRAEDMLVRLSRTGVAPYAARAQDMLAEQTSAPAGPFKELALPLDYDRGSPDGRFIVYHKDRWKSGVLYLKELATGVERVLVDGGYIMWPAWSPDSTRLAYVFWSGDEKIREIRIVRVSDGETHKLGVHGWPISWTDTDEIFFFLPNYGAGGDDYFLLPATGGTARKVYTGSVETLTPDGSRLIASRSDKLFVINLATGQPQALTHFAGSESGAMISPDGRLVAFSANPEGRWALYLAPLDKGLPVKNPLKVKNIDVGDAPAYGRPWRKWWTRNGILTFPLGRSEANIYRVDVDPKSGRPVDAPLRLTQDAGRNESPSISPDGKRIAYWYTHRGKEGLAVMDSSGVGERPLFEQAANVEPLYWQSLDQVMFLNTKPSEGKNQAIYSLNVNTGALARVVELQGLYWHYVPSRNEILEVVQPATVKAISLADGKPRVVATVDNLNSMMALSPDGKRIAYMTGGRGQSAENFSCEMSLMSTDGKPLGKLLPLQQDYITPNAWSPDGVYLLYTGKEGPRVMNVGTRESWPLHKETSDGDWEGGSWSPDGTFILVVKKTQTEDRLAWEGVTYEAAMRLLAAK